MFAAQAKLDPLQPPQRSEPDGSGGDAQRDLSAAEAKPDDRDVPQRGGRRYAGRPDIGNNKFIWIMATAAARPTNKVVRSPAALPCSVRL
jgi:hypothetical protein